MRRVWVLLSVVLLVGCAGVTTPTPTPSGAGSTNATATRGAELTQVAAVLSPSPSLSPLPVRLASVTSAPNTPTSLAGASANASPTPTGAATVAATPSVAPIAAVASAPMSVTVTDGPANVRQSPNPNAPILATLDTGTDVQFIEADIAGTDGATRYVHVIASGKEGYIRGDLVGAPHGITQTPIAPTGTADPRKPITITGKSISLTLYQLYDPAPSSSFSQPHAGNRFVAFDVAIGNMSNTQQSYNLLYFYLKTSDSRKYDTAIFGSTLAPAFSSGKNQTGDNTRGWVTFEIPRGAVLATLGYEPILGDSLMLTFR